MNRLLYNVLIFTLATGVAITLAFFSIQPTESARSTIGQNEGKRWFKVILSSENNSYKAKLEEIDASKTASQNTPMMIEFGRLSTFIYLAPTGDQSKIFTQSGATGIVLGETSGIVSLYDLFQSYTIYDNENRFRLEQITNGSFYVGKEDDGKIALYAIDGVVRLHLVHDGEDMTNLILFPGSYIRFDPTRNRSLKNADLFRTILSLKEIDKEVFEYVNPRVNIGDDKEVFFNYRLSSVSKVLFQTLSARFQESVNQTKQVRQRYIAYANSSVLRENTMMFNPSKKNHNLLIELSTLLSGVLDTGSNPEQKIVKISELYNKTKVLKLQESTARALVEQFLLDGRFAQYSGASGQRYQQVYEDIARLIGIERTDAKSRLFQNLADIYSRNLYLQKRSDTLSTFISTFAPTASELASTFGKNEIAKRDYFDIAIYAYNILRKVEEKPQLLPISALEDVSTYSYLMTFFQASDLYIDSVTDIEKKQQTIVSFSRQFYDYILGLIVNSLYSGFIVEDEGALYLDQKFRDGNIIKINEEIIESINTFYLTADSITDDMQNLWTASDESDNLIFKRIQTNMMRLKVFNEIINPEKYSDYINTPFVYDANSTDYKFPLIDTGSNMPIRVEASIIEMLKNTKKLTSDPRITELKKIWPDADPTSWILEGDDIRVIRAPYSIGRNNRGNSLINISALYRNKTFADGLIFYEGYQMRIVTENPMTLAVYKEFLIQLEAYLDFVDEELLKREGEEVGEIAIFPMVQRIRIGDSLYSISIPNLDDR